MKTNTNPSRYPSYKISSMKTNTNPSHYSSHKVSPLELIEEYDLNFACGNVIKYVARHEEKNGREDLIKALWYLLRELGMPMKQIRRLTQSLENKNV